MSPTTRLSTSAINLHPPHSTSSVVAAASAVSSASEVWPDRLPDLPPAAVWAIAGGLGFLFVAAICLLMINFYPRHPPREQVKTKRGYTEVAQGDVELDSHCTSRTPLPDRQNDWLQKTTGCAEDSPGVDDCASMLRRRKPANLRIDTKVQYTGLGIAVPGKKTGRLHSPPPPSRRAPSDDTISSSSSNTTSSSAYGSLRVPLQEWTPLPSPLLAPAIGNVHSRRSKHRPKKSHRDSHRRRSPAMLELIETSRPRAESRPADLYSRDKPTKGHSRSPRYISLQTHHQHISDLEAGTLAENHSDWAIHHASRTADSSPPETPYVTPEESPPPSRTSSTLNLLLQTADDAIDYTTRKLAKMVYDQVNKDDPEEGLLLPIAGWNRGERRGRRSF